MSLDHGRKPRPAAARSRHRARNVVDCLKQRALFCKSGQGQGREGAERRTRADVIVVVSLPCAPHNFNINAEVVFRLRGEPCKNETLLSQMGVYFKR